MRKCFVFCLIFVIITSLTACGNDTSGNTETEETIVNGVVESSDAFIDLGFLIDVEETDAISNVSYEIIDEEIGEVSFVYNGIDCELRASTVYKEYELAGVENTSSESSLSTSVKGYSAVYYRLNPGRIVFWNDDNINYSLYLYVTANDEVVDSIADCLIIENHYSERRDVQESIDNACYDFGNTIITVFQNKDLEQLSEMMYYPQQLESGESVANKSELLALSEDVVFTDKLLEALTEDAADEIRLTTNEESYVIGGNYQNIYFKLQDDGTFKITKINN